MVQKRFAFSAPQSVCWTDNNQPRITLSSNDNFPVLYCLGARGGTVQLVLVHILCRIFIFLKMHFDCNGCVQMNPLNACESTEPSANPSGVWPANVWVALEDRRWSASRRGSHCTVRGLTAGHLPTESGPAHVTSPWLRLHKVMNHVYHLTKKSSVNNLDTSYLNLKKIVLS